MINSPYERCWWLPKSRLPTKKTQNYIPGCLKYIFVNCFKICYLLKKRNFNEHLQKKRKKVIHILRLTLYAKFEKKLHQVQVNKKELCNHKSISMIDSLTQLLHLSIILYEKMYKIHFRWKSHIFSIKTNNQLWICIEAETNCTSIMQECKINW